MEVHEVHAAAAPHQPPRRHRRVDAAREQADDAAADADRQTTSAWILAEVVERFVGQRFDMNRQLRLRQVHVPAASFLDPSADFTLELRRRQRKALVGAAHRDAKRPRIVRAEVAQNLLRNHFDIELRSPGTSKVRGAKDIRQAIANGRPFRGLTEDDLDAPLQRTHALDVEVRRRLAEIANETRHEPRPVPALERDFLVVNHYRFHL